MLSLSNVSVGMASSYFEADDYYSEKDSKSTVEFYGKAAEFLGVKTRFDRETFNNLLQGYSPDGKTQIIASPKRAITQSDFNKSVLNFDKTAIKIGISEKHAGYVKDLISKKVQANLEHLTTDESVKVRATVSEFIKNLDVDGETKKQFKNSSSKLVKAFSQSNHRAGLDCTFSAPKSVSIACLVGDKIELLKAHQEAVDYALSYIEKEEIGTRVGSPQDRRFVKTGNLICAKFLHGTSRESDPQLHTHSVILNMTRRADGEWRSLHNDSIFKKSKLLGTIYQNKLAELVQKLGYGIEVKTNGTFELEGYSKEQLDGFSKRRKQVVENSAKLLYGNEVREFFREKGLEFKENKSTYSLNISVQKAEELGLRIVSKSEKGVLVDGFSGTNAFEEKAEELKKHASQKLNRYTVKQDRKTKAEVEPNLLMDKWTKEAESLSITHPSPHVGRSIFGTKLDQDFAIEHVRERTALFKEDELRLHSLTRNLGRNTFEKICSDLSQHESILSLQRDRSLKTSDIQVAEELAILKLAREGKNRFKPIGTSKLADKISSQKGYTTGQEEALKQALISKDQTFIWNGVAGSGKTFALADLGQIASKNGYKVIGLAPDASTAKTLGKSIGMPTTTIHSHLLKAEPSNRKTLLIVDESSRISTKLMSRLLHSVKDTNTRVLFTGDYRQLGAVEAGNPFGSLMKSGVSTAHLTEHRRQKNSDLKQAVESISEGKYQQIKAGLDKLSDHIFERKGQDARINFVAKRFLALSQEDREKTLVLADTNIEKETLTRKIREGLKDLGHLDRRDFAVQTLNPKDFTEAQKRVAAFYERGMVVMTNSKSRSLETNEQYTIVDRTGKHLILESKRGIRKVDPKTENLSVYESKTLQIAAGDKLEWRRNHDKRINREQVTVETIDGKKAILRTESGDKESIDLRTKQLFDYAHVKTTYSSQGLTAERVIALTHSNLSKESLYVLTSRAMHGVEIVTDSKEKLLARASRSSEKSNVMDGAKTQDILNLSQSDTQSNSKSKGIELDLIH